MAVLTLRKGKGGVGATTLAACFAVQAQAEGLNPLVVDLDPLGAISTWCDVRERNGNPRIEYAASNTATIARLIEKNRNRMVIVDTPSSGAMLGLMRLSDVIVAPTLWGGLDLSGIGDVADDVERAGRPVVCVLNGIWSNVPVPAGTLHFLQVNKMKPKAHIHQRVAFRHCLAAGLSVTEAEKPDLKAVAELQATWDVVKSELEAA